MKKCIVFGTTYFAEMLCHYVEKYNGVEVVAYTVDEKYKNCDEIYGRPLVAFEGVEALYPPEEYSMLIGLGYNGVNELRKNKFLAVKAKGYDIESFVHPTAARESEDIGEGNIILENATIGYRVKIGDGNILWNGVNISHHSTIGDFCFFAPSAVVAGNATVEDQCFIGINAAIKGALTIGRKTLVGAGAYINRSTEADSVHVPSRSKKLENKTSEDFL